MIFNIVNKISRITGYFLVLEVQLINIDLALILLILFCILMLNSFIHWYIRWDS